jgi:hypothetical protein
MLEHASDDSGTAHRTPDAADRATREPPLAGQRSGTPRRQQARRSSFEERLEKQ